jgi:hypothetical protein
VDVAELLSAVVAVAVVAVECLLDRCMASAEDPMWDLRCPMVPFEMTHFPQCSMRAQIRML